MAVDDVQPASSRSSMVDIKEELPPSEVGSKRSTIHSGHFMVSRVHDVNNDDTDEEEVASPFSEDVKGYDFLSANKEPSTTYNFSAANNTAAGIDASLTKLFECMSLAYSGKITSPRWKQFRGLHLSQKQRIRLNNLIWREWHMQYIYSKMPMVCQFATPLSDDIHSKPEAVVLEGKYWKRRLDTVTAEYKKWRRYFKERIRQQQGINFRENQSLNERELLERVKEVTFIPHSSGSYMSSTDLNLLQADMMDMDFTNELFASLNQPFAFPNPRELSQLGCADLIQPGLVQLQPNLEEFMDIDSMQDFFNAKTPSTSSTAFMPDTASSIDIGQGSIQGSDMSLVDFLSSPASNIASGGSRTQTENISSSVSTIGPSTLLTSNAGVPQNITFQLTADGQYQLDPSSILFGTSIQQGLTTVTPQTFTVVPTGIYANFNSMADTPNTSQKQVTASVSSELLAQLLQQQQQPPGEVMVAPKKDSHRQTPAHIQPAPSLVQQSQQHLSQPQQQSQQQLFQSSLSSQSPLLAQSLATAPQQQLQKLMAVPNTTQQKKSTKINKMHKHSGSHDTSGTAGNYSGQPKSSTFSNNKKKDGLFAVPTAKPILAPRKNRVIAPAPPATPVQQNTVTPSPSSQASYLAELLKNGTYPGALINVKKEPTPQPAVAAASPIRTTTNIFQQIRPSVNPNFNQPAMVTMTRGGQIQTPLPLLTATTASPIEGLQITSQGLSGVILSSTSSNFEPTSPPTPKETTVRFSPSVSKAPSTQSPSTSPSSLLPKSPISSPQMVKRSPSPNPPMDTSSLIEPVSPYSSSTLPMSPSPLGGPDSPGSSESAFPRDNRRAAHLSAEQKRRCNLKTGFDMLQQLVPSLSQNPKVSKATMLQKTAEYCKKLKTERSQMQKEATILKQEIDALNSAISVVQSQLPETGVPVTRQRKDQMKEMFDGYVRTRTLENWKFWIFSVIMNAMYDSYCNTVSTSSMEELCRTSLTWLDQSCSLVTLRPNVLDALRRLSKSTSILTEPQKVKEQALQTVKKQSKPVHRSF